MVIFHLYYDMIMAGIQTMLVNIANEQVLAGHQVKILILNDAVNQSLYRSLSNKVELVNFGKKVRSKNLYPIVKMNVYLITHHFDILHVHNPRLSRMIFIPIPQNKKCCTLHCLCNGRLDSDYLFKFNHNFAISKAVKQDIYDKYKIKAITVYNGIEISCFKNSGTKKSQTDGKFHILQVGRLYTDVKGQDLTIKAISLLEKDLRENVVVDFIGDDQNQGLESLKLLVKELDLQNQVNFLGLQNQAYVANHICEYDLYVQPSRKEGFGLTVAEAMASKVPVLVSDVAGPMDVIENGTYGFYFKNGEEQDYSNKLAVIMKMSTQDIDRLVEKAYQRVADNFDVKVTANNYLMEYQKILANS